MIVRRCLLEVPRRRRAYAWAFVCLVPLSACTETNPRYGGRLGAADGTPAVDAATSRDGETPADAEADVETSDAQDPSDAGREADTIGDPPDAPVDDVAVGDMAVAREDAASDRVLSGAPSLFGWWKLDEAAGATIVVDSSGNGHDGVLEGLNATTAWTVGKRGGAVSFPIGAANCGIRVPDSNHALEGLNHFTLAAWINRAAGPKNAQGSVISRQFGTGSAEVYNLLVHSDGAVVGYVHTGLAPPDGGANPYVQLANAARTGTWTHVALSYDGTMVRLYKDGAQVNALALPDSAAATTTPLYIGTNQNGTYDQPFEGLIDDVVVFDGALPAASIAALTNGQDPRTL